MANAGTTQAVRTGSGELRVLGIETSCDETAAAVVSRAPDGTGRILSNVVRSQWEAHRAYGGVVPEIAARAHVACLDEIIRAAMTEAAIDWAGLDAVAVTAGPGLVGGLIVGITTAKAIALAQRLPLIAVNHLAAHALTVGLTEGLRPPYLLLLASGGHTQLIDVVEADRFDRLGTTIDDALGEAFDKTAKLLDLGFPGGPAVEAAAREGDEERFQLPRPMVGRAEPNFSFAGLKTAVRNIASSIAPLSSRDVADVAAAFQATAAAAVVDRVKRAMAMCEARRQPPQHGHVLVVSGGVAANLRLRAALKELADCKGWRLSLPPIALCTDNAAMVAWAGAERLHHDSRASDPLDTPARARWPLDPDAAPALGSGRLGAKA
ncbi:MAG: tRNA (adenosine(37)-N6)-threonylcarbamoyltransferase complex transferase subunit TsaD [Hyphomicrobiaceae bacterium]